MQKYVTFWEGRRDGFLLDIQNINSLLATAEEDQKAALRKQKADLSDELAIAYEALERLANKA